eukprot:6213783-Pleurochrysis_carterae.AAC.2
MIQQTEYETVHVLYDDTMKHYEYFGRDIRKVGTSKEPEQNRGSKEQERQGNRTEEDKGVSMAEHEESPRNDRREEESEPTT